MNISGIRTCAGFYDYNSIKSQELQNAQTQEKVPESRMAAAQKETDVLTLQEAQSEASVPVSQEVQRESHASAAQAVQNKTVVSAAQTMQTETAVLPQAAVPQSEAPGDYAGQYQLEFVYALRGVDSASGRLDVEMALSAMKKDDILERYQFFVGAGKIAEGAAENRAGEYFCL